MSSVVNEWLSLHTGYEQYTNTTDVYSCDVLCDEDGGVEEQSVLRHNPYKHLRFGSEEAREMTKQYTIYEQCKYYYPVNEFHAFADLSLEDVLDASKYIKMSALNPLKLFAYCFVLRSQLSSKRALLLLNLPYTKSGKQFGILCKGRQIYQYYMFTKYQYTGTQLPTDRPRVLIPDSQNDAQIIKQELLTLHMSNGTFTNCTIDVINKTAELITSTKPGQAIRCQKKYKLIIYKIKTDELFKDSVSRAYADRCVIVLRKRK